MLKVANKAATRRKSHKRKRIQVEGTIKIKDRERLATLQDFSARRDGKKPKKQVGAEAGEPSQRRCGRCHKTGHNSRTCKQVAEVASK